MDLKFEDYENIEVVVDDIRYELYKDHLGLKITRLDGEPICIGRISDKEILIDGADE